MTGLTQGTDTDPEEVIALLADLVDSVVEITIEGNAAHGSRPELGVDAIMNGRSRSGRPRPTLHTDCRP